MNKYLWSIFFFAAACEAKLSKHYKGHLTRDAYHQHIFSHIVKDEQCDYYANEDEKNSEYWSVDAQNTIKAKLANELNTNQAKNVIMFLGDGCSFSTWFATRVYMAQQRNLTGGEEFKLAVDQFPYSGLSKTYCLDSQVADSACSATAYLTGVKNNIGTIGVNGHVPYNDCKASIDERTHTLSIAREFQLAGKKTGVVTTTRITHATPAGAYASVANRGWENDAHVRDDNANPKQCPDIAYQLVHGDTGKGLNVVLGGGSQNFLPPDVNDPSGKPGQRDDGRNLIDEWIQQKADLGASAAFVTNKDELFATTKVDYLFGLFASSHLQYNLIAPETQPRLKDLTQAAIKQLASGEEGYFLLVEGGRIDHGHHDNFAKKALDETAEFDAAIAMALEMTSDADTLIMTTSDHSHAMITSGYPKRGNNIFGIAGKGSDGIDYSTISYANGKYGFKSKDGERYSIRDDDREADDYRFPAFVPIDSATHAGEDVGIFCSGPWAHFCSGVMEQNAIPHLLKFAACVGDGEQACGQPGHHPHRRT